MSDSFFNQPKKKPVKIPTQSSIKSISLAAGLALALMRFNAGAAIAYYDPTGTTGNAQTSGPWEGSVWSSSLAGQATPTAWVEGTAAGFSSGVGTAASSYVVTANANHTVPGFFNGGIGSPQLKGNLTINGAGIITMPPPTHRYRASIRRTVQTQQFC